MTSMVAKYATKYASKKIMGEAWKENKGKPVAGDIDTLFMKDKHGKKVQKGIPDYLPEEEAKILAKTRKMAYRLDMCFNIGGFRFGVSALWALIPELGDCIDAVWGLGLINLCRKSDAVTGSVVVSMMINLIIDFLVGLIPLIGDFADAKVKANAKNVRLLEKALDKKYCPEETKRYMKENRIPPCTKIVYDEEIYDDVPHREKSSRHGHQEPMRPAAARVHDDERRQYEDDVRDGRYDDRRDYDGRRDTERRGGGGWFSGNKSARRADEETGRAPREPRQKLTRDSSRRDGARR